MGGDQRREVRFCSTKAANATAATARDGGSFPGIQTQRRCWKEGLVKSLGLSGSLSAVPTDAHLPFPRPLVAHHDQWLVSGEITHRQVLSCSVGADWVGQAQPGQMLPSDDWRAVSRSLHRFSTGCVLYKRAVQEAVCVLPFLIAMLGYHTAKPATEIV